MIQNCTVARFLYDWQTLIAGGFAVLAAGWTVWATTKSASREVKASQEQTAVAQKQIETTVRLEQDRVAGEVDALRKSLAVELRLQMSTALGVYDRLYGLGFMPNAPITAKMVESKSRMAAPIIYPANAGKIGLLGAEAMGVMIAYDLLEAARNGVAQLIPSDDMAPADIMETANAFLAACVVARSLLSKLRTGDPSHDAADEALIRKINDALATRGAALAARGA